MECMMDSDETMDSSEFVETDPEKRRMQNLLELIALQSADGSFSGDKSIFSLCHLKEEEVEKVRGSLEEKVFYTSLLILLLELRFSELKDCWEMVSEKGKLWLQGKPVPETVKQQLQDIVKN